MKITEQQLRQIIREELLESGVPQPYYPPGDPRAVRDFPQEPPALTPELRALNKRLNDSAQTRVVLEHRLGQLREASVAGRVYTSRNSNALIYGYYPESGQILGALFSAPQRLMIFGYEDIKVVDPSGVDARRPELPPAFLINIPRRGGSISRGFVKDNSWPQEVTLAFANEGSLLIAWGEEPDGKFPGFKLYPAQEGAQMAQKVFRMGDPNPDTSIELLAQLNR
jgi:hypothetical protein